MIIRQSRFATIHQPLPFQCQRHPIGNRQHRQRNAFVGMKLLIQVANGDGVVVLNGQIHRLAVPQHIVNHDQSARPDELQRAFVILDVTTFISVDESEVESFSLSACSTRALKCGTNTFAGAKITPKSKGLLLKGARPYKPYVSTIRFASELDGFG